MKLMCCTEFEAWGDCCCDWHYINTLGITVHSQCSKIAMGQNKLISGKFIIKSSQSSLYKCHRVKPVVGNDFSKWPYEKLGLLWRAAPKNTKTAPGNTIRQWNCEIDSVKMVILTIFSVLSIYNQYSEKQLETKCGCEKSESVFAILLV